MAWLRIALAPALLCAVLWAVDLQDVARLLREARPGWLLVALGCSVASNLVSAWRWRSLVRWLGHGLASARACSLYFQGLALGTVLPGAAVGGDVYRAVALRRDGMDTLAAGLSVLLDRLSGLWMLWVLAAFAAACSADAQTALARWGFETLGAALPAGAALALLLLPLGMLCLLRHVGLRRVSLAMLWARPGMGLEFVRQLLSSLLVQLWSVAALACGGQALGLDLAYWAYAIAAAPTFMMAALPVSFGGWGTREAAAALSLAPFGVAAPAAVAVSVLYGLMALPQAAAGLWLLSGHRWRRDAPAP